MKPTSTQEYEFTAPFDFTQYVKAFIATFKQGDEILFTKTEEDIGASVALEGNVMRISLSQEETANFEQGMVDFELKVHTMNGKVAISDTITLVQDEVLNRELFDI